MDTILQLKNIKENNFKPFENTDIDDLTLFMLREIGNLDPYLRDTLINDVFSMFIENGVYQDRKLEEILNVLLDQEHLFFNIGHEDDSSVFKRSFSMLIIAEILRVNTKNNFLSQEVLKIVQQDFISYYNMERDLRGYVKDAGWAHSVAHAADCLKMIVHSPYVEKDFVNSALKGITTKFCIHNYVYINEEDERTVSAVVAMYQNGHVSDQELIDWLNDFEKAMCITAFPQRHYLLTNVKGLLRSMYFRFSKYSISPEVMESIRQVLIKNSKF